MRQQGHSIVLEMLFPCLEFAPDVLMDVKVVARPGLLPFGEERCSTQAHLER
jgi:hypothetical protein